MEEPSLSDSGKGSATETDILAVFVVKAIYDVLKGFIWQGRNWRSRSVSHTCSGKAGQAVERRVRRLWIR